jgi:outer membrane receptor for Fe3+-dicitrate
MTNWVPLYTTLLWVLLIAILLVVFRKTLKHLQDRVEAGAPLKVGPLEVGPGPLITETAQLGPEVDTYGDPDQLRVLFKVQGRDWKKSTKALQTPSGCLVQVTTERMNRNGEWTTAEALQFVPGVCLLENREGGGFTLGSLS